MQNVPVFIQETTILELPRGGCFGGKAEGFWREIMIRLQLQKIWREDQGDT